MKQKIELAIWKTRWKKNTQSEQQNETRLKKNEDGLRELWDNIKCNNTCIIGIPEGEEIEQRIEKLFEEIMTENFPNVVKDKFIKVQEILDTVLVNPVPAHKVSSNIY